MEINPKVLRMIAEIGNTGLLRKLVSIGYNIHQLIEGNNICHIAAEEGNLGFLRVCIEEFNISVDIENNTGCVPLACALNSEEPDPVVYGIVKLLLKYAEPKGSLIYTAIDRKNYDIVKMLVKSGINVTHKLKGQIPREYYESTGMIGLIELFESPREE
jgi:hypothetical protein